jgi:hypothetical protein
MRLIWTDLDFTPHHISIPLQDQEKHVNQKASAPSSVKRSLNFYAYTDSHIVTQELWN